MDTPWVPIFIDMIQEVIDSLNAISLLLIVGVILLISLNVIAIVYLKKRK